jgi:hypothetical protein
MPQRVDHIDSIADNFRAFAAMGLTLREACRACPFPINLSRPKLIASLRTHGVVFPETRESKQAQKYATRTKKKSIRQAIRESGVPISAQAVRYRITRMNWSLDKALSTPVMTRAESGRLGVRGGVHTLPDGQTTFKFMR